VVLADLTRVRRLAFTCSARPIRRWPSSPVAAGSPCAILYPIRDIVGVSMAEHTDGVIAPQSRRARLARVSIKKDQLRDLYLEERLPTSRIARAFECSETTIFRLLRRFS